MISSFSIRPEAAADAFTIAALHDHAFGPGAYARAAFRVREQALHDMPLSSVGIIDGRMVSSVRLTPVKVGEERGLLLGPLVVDPAYKNLGYGKALLRHSLAAAKAAGEPFILLVGDHPYYGPFGFRPIPPGRVAMPGPVDPARLLVAELAPNAAENLRGMVRGDTRSERSV